MKSPLSFLYSNRMDIGINTVTKKWAGFIILHFHHPKTNFNKELEQGVKDIAIVEKGFQLTTKGSNIGFISKQIIFGTTRLMGS